MSWLKQNLVRIGIGVLILIAIFWINKKTAVVSKATSPSPSSIDVQDLTSAIKRVESEQPSRIGASPTEEEIYTNPFIKHIRIALNGYLDGSNKGIDDPEYAVNGSEDMPDCGLGKFNKDYYRSKFIVFNASDNDYGGVQTDIVFINKPDTIFWAWVYRLAGGEYTLRGFCSNGPAEDKKPDFAEYIKDVIKNSKFSL